jgi:aryl-alcohol dehydrogenase-like predicted oxidoreductase
MTFGDPSAMGADQSECSRMFGAYKERGGNFIDTANKYANGASESLVGDFVRGQRDRFVIATKYSLTMRHDDPNASGNHRKNMRQSLEASLVRLKTDYVDLFWLHAWDFTTSPEEVMRSLDDLVRAGKVLYVGISDTPAWVVSQANTLAELRGWNRFVGVQFEYSLTERTAERDLLPMARALDIGVAAWAPLAGGILTGKYTRTAKAVDSERVALKAARSDERSLRIAREVDRVAAELRVSSVSVALAWLRQQHPSIIPIVGARTAEQLAESLSGVDVQLPEQQLAALDRVSSIEAGFPHEFLARPECRENMFGNTGSRLVRRMNS